MTTTREVIEEQLAAAREEIERALEAATNDRDGLNRTIKLLRQQLDALPKLAVKRTRKAKASPERALAELDEMAKVLGAPEQEFES